MGHSKKPRRGRARDGSADALFERALLGDRSLNERTFDPREDRKTLQLCRQVQRALSLAIPSAGADDALAETSVESVEPMGGPGQLLVRVVVAPGAGVAPGEVVARLTALAPRLRAAVASGISRKRVPTLSFLVVPGGGPEPRGSGEGEGGNHVD